MGTMMLVYMIAPMILFLINIIYGRKNNSWLKLNGFLLLLFAGVTFLRVYINLPSRNLLSILISNGFWGIIYELITLSAWNDFSNGDKKWSKLLLGCISVCAGAFIIGCIGEVHSKLSVKPT